MATNALQQHAERGSYTSNRLQSESFVYAGQLTFF